MSGGEQPSEAFTPALPRLEKKGRGEFTACESENFTPLHTKPSCPADLTPTAPRPHSQVEETLHAPFPFRSVLAQGVKVTHHPTHPIYFVCHIKETWVRRASDVHFVVLKVLPGSFIAFHHSVLLLMTLMTHKKLGNKRSATFSTRHHKKKINNCDEDWGCICTQFLDTQLHVKMIVGCLGSNITAKLNTFFIYYFFF